MHAEVPSKRTPARRGEADRASEADRLARASVLVIGVGALGSPAAWHLAAAGIGSLVLADPDRVEISNLPRQLLYRMSSLGEPKADLAAARLRSHFPGLRVHALRSEVDAANAAPLIAAADFTIDATDGVMAKFTINDSAVALGRAFCHAGILGFQGQLLTVRPGVGPCLRCLFPEAPDDLEIASCRQAGVAGPVAAIIGALQAREAIACLLGHKNAAGEEGLLTYDGRADRWRRIAMRRNPNCPMCADSAMETALAQCGS